MQWSETNPPVRSAYRVASAASAKTSGSSAESGGMTTQTTVYDDPCISRFLLEVSWPRTLPRRGADLHGRWLALRVPDETLEQFVSQEPLETLSLPLGRLERALRRPRILVVAEIRAE